MFTCIINSWTNLVKNCFILKCSWSCSCAPYINRLLLSPVAWSMIISRLLHRSPVVSTETISRTYEVLCKPQFQLFPVSDRILESEIVSFASYAMRFLHRTFRLTSYFNFPGKSSSDAPCVHHTTCSQLRFWP